MPSSVVLGRACSWSSRCGAAILILKPSHNAVLAAYSVLMMWRMGGEFVLTASQMDLEGPTAKVSAADEASAANEAGEASEEGKRFALPVLTHLHR